MVGKVGKEGEAGGTEEGREGLGAKKEVLGVEG
jgi:hypothetical protein